MASPERHGYPFQLHGGVEDGHPHAQSSISKALDKVLDGFDMLQGQQAATPRVTRAVEDSVSRIRVWAGNIGAFHALEDRRSAAFRLRSAPAVSQRIVELLEEIYRDCHELLSILRGEREDASEGTALEDLDEEDLALLETMDEAESEAQELADSVAESITSLFRISILLRRATPRDRYARAKTTLQSPLFTAFAVYDRRHVAEKFPKVERDSALQERLGNAITERRRYLRYAREHHTRIATPCSPEDRALRHQLQTPGATHVRTDGGRTASERPSRMATEASTLQPSFNAVAPGETDPYLGVVDDDDSAYSQATSRTSFLDRANKDGRLEVITLQDICNDGRPFECPYCWQIIMFKRQSAWRKHVMRDLRAYTCTFADCAAGLFEHRGDWFEHELKLHRRIWICPSCSESNKSYTSAPLLWDHLREKHNFSSQTPEISSMLDACSRPIAHMPAASACPLCDDYDATCNEGKGSVPIIATSEIKQHLADHLEQLALFAIVPSNDDHKNLAFGEGEIDRGSVSGHYDSDLKQDLSDAANDEDDIARAAGETSAGAEEVDNVSMPEHYDADSERGGSDNASSDNDEMPLAKGMPMQQEHVFHPRQSLDVDNQSKKGELDTRIVDPHVVREDKKPKGILKMPTTKFPEHTDATREDVAPLDNTNKNSIPPGARWTKIDRRLVNPEALEQTGERFEERQDSVIVLRVLTKEEIQKLADLTHSIRARAQEEQDGRRSSRKSRSRKLSKDRRGHDDCEVENSVDEDDYRDPKMLRIEQN